MALLKNRYFRNERLNALRTQTRFLMTSYLGSVCQKFKHLYPDNLYRLLYLFSCYITAKQAELLLGGKHMTKNMKVLNENTSFLETASNAYFIAIPDFQNRKSKKCQ